MKTSLKYQNVNTGVESITFEDYDGSPFESFQGLRQSLERNDIQLYSQILGNFSFYMAFVGSQEELHEYWVSDCMEDIEGGHISMQRAHGDLSFKELKKILRGSN